MRGHWVSHRPGRLAATAVAAAMLIVPARAAAWEWVVGPPREVVVSWNLERPREAEGLHTLTIRLLGGYCVGEAAPVAGAVSIQELPVTAAHPRPTAIIVAHQWDPAPVEVAGEVLPGEPTPACADVGWTTTKRIKLKRPVAGMVLIDGAYGKLVRRSPPGGMP